MLRFTTHRVASTDGVTLAAYDFGGAGPTVLFCHATGFHAMVWAPLITILSGEFRCLALDFRAHGDASTPPGTPLGWNGFADDVLAVIDSFDLTSEPLFGVGHSMGGATILIAEERFPGTFAGMYLYEPVVFPKMREVPRPSANGNGLADSARRRRPTFDSYEAAIANYSAKPPLNSFHPDALDAYVRHGFAQQADGTVTLKCRPEDEAQIFEMSGEYDTFAHLDRVKCPVVIASGALDPTQPSGFAPQLVPQLARGRFEGHDDFGHFGPLEDPAKFAASIRTALA